MSAEPRPVQRGEVLLGTVGTPSRPILLTVVSVKGNKVKCVANLGYATMDTESTWPGAELPSDWRRVSVEEVTDAR